MGLFFLLWPLAEVFVLYQLTLSVGFFETLALLLFKAVAGIAIFRSQGQSFLVRAQSSFMQGQVPASEIMRGVMICVGGFLLMIPGVLISIFGLLMILPGTRHLLSLFLGRFLMSQVQRGRVRVFGNMGGMGGGCWQQQRQRSL